jgi:hypothetical protein
MVGQVVKKKSATHIFPNKESRVMRFPVWLVNSNSEIVSVVNTGNSFFAGFFSGLRVLLPEQLHNNIKRMLSPKICFMFGLFF